MQFGLLIAVSVFLLACIDSELDFELGEKDCFAVPQITILDQKNIDATLYSLVHSRGGLTEKVDIIYLYQGELRFDECRNALATHLWSEAVERSQMLIGIEYGHKQFYLVYEKGNNKTNTSIPDIKLPNQWPAAAGAQP